MTKEELTKLGVPPELHEDATLKEVKDVPTALKMVVDLKAYQGSSIRIPNKDAGEEVRKEFEAKLRERVPNLVEVPTDEEALAKVEPTLFERLGRPKDAKGYPSLKDAKIEVPEGVTVDEEALRTTAGRLGLTKKQYVELARGAVEETTKVTQLRSENRAKLKTELGDAFEERLTAAAATAKKLGADDKLVTAIQRGAVEPEVAKLWINAAKSIGAEGSGLGTGGRGGGEGKMTPAEAEAAIQEMMRNSALFDGSHPDNQRLTRKFEELHKIAYPG